ncbi:DUF502 domain-containing protein [Halococcus hamelinensis]|jgi:uncharacterized membrane protein|uniref:DUF502 domain-containing protein n=1 Tax=Halococcus hamelinensis 100A6 TaxID=1132509 RepID=M0M4K1_9EURY|nr:DUF502 domain-containing protein [Halococcus hamelinensis]EMA40616.1 hypothetical protein C447_03821 [Halococcus hamelinensis 100A6]
MTSLRRDATSGLVVLVPIIVSLYVLAFIYRTIAQLPLIETIEPAVVRVPLTLVVFAALVLAIGYLMRTASGPLVEEAIDGVINRVPGLRVVYNASKMGVETAVTGTGDLQAPVKLETWEGLRMTAFKTGTRTDDGRDILFLPTAPNITTGFVIEVTPDRYEETDERVEDALTRVLSAGFGEADDVGVPTAGRTPSPNADDD